MNGWGELRVKGGSLTYLAKAGEIEITICHVQESFFEIPDRIEGLPVTGIAKKAILGNKMIRELVLPGELKEAGDWALAHCSQLEKVWLPRKDIVFGKGVFRECRKLSRIYFREEEDEKLAGLLSMVPVRLDAEYLLTPLEAGKDAWLYKLDARLRTLLDRPDEDGYLKQVLCGEEDLMASLDIYLADRHREKAALCFERLLSDIGLKEEFRQFLQEYLRANTKGCAYEAAWETVYREHGQEKEYYQVFADAGCITEENFDGLLADLGEDHPEMKAWLLRYKEGHFSGDDFFAGLSLD